MERIQYLNSIDRLPILSPIWYQKTYKIFSLNGHAVDTIRCVIRDDMRMKTNWLNPRCIIVALVAYKNCLLATVPLFTWSLFPVRRTATPVVYSPKQQLLIHRLAYWQRSFRTSARKPQMRKIHWHEVTLRFSFIHLITHSFVGPHILTATIFSPSRHNKTFHAQRKYECDNQINVTVCAVLNLFKNKLWQSDGNVLLSKNNGIVTPVMWILKRGYYFSFCLK